MIHPDSRTIEWIETYHNENKKLDKQLIEKTIRALSLLEALALSGCPFYFKGGSCCMLHLNSEKRLSTDIDIICPPGTDIANYLESGLEKYGFSKVKLIERKSRNNVPKSHAKFYYTVSYKTNTDEDNILLDVLYEDLHYGNIIQLPIRSCMLKTYGEDIYVNVPSPEDILGDKLTAFAPHTTGIPFFKDEKKTTLEVIKQMYDIASLSSIVKDYEQVKSTFEKFAVVELGYRNRNDIGPADVLRDAFNGALCITLKGTYLPDEFLLYMDGIKKIDSLIIGKRYILESAITDAAKVAYIATMLLHNKSQFDHYEDASYERIKEMNISTSLNSKLNKLKRTNPEAFFYWALTDQLIQ